MRTIIITLAIAALAFAGTINDSFGSNNFYKNHEINKAGQIVKTTVCRGENEKNLTLVKQLENKYDNDGNIRERIFYAWNSTLSKWDPSHKYQYDYTLDGELQMISYTVFNESGEVWENEVTYAMYMYNSEGNLLTVDYLNIGNKEYEVLASDFSIK